jgi:hypothetical protein
MNFYGGSMARKDGQEYLHKRLPNLFRSKGIDLVGF